jgi:hypothetical protein
MTAAMEAARNRLKVAAKAKDISSVNLKNAQAACAAAVVAAAATHTALVAALAHEKEAYLIISRSSAGIAGNHHCILACRVNVQLKASVIAARDDDNAGQALLSARRALNLAKNYHDEASKRMNDAVGCFIFI